MNQQDHVLLAWLFCASSIVTPVPPPTWSRHGFNMPIKLSNVWVPRRALRVDCHLVWRWGRIRKDIFGWAWPLIMQFQVIPQAHTHTYTLREKCLKNFIIFLVKQLWQTCLVHFETVVSQLNQKSNLSWDYQFHE